MDVEGLQRQLDLDLGLKARPRATAPALDAQQLSFDWALPVSLGPEDFSVSESNADAHALVAGGLKWPDGKLALVGPPGSGKTAVAARLAASARLVGRPVVVRSTDTARAGGVEQLRALLAPLRLAPEAIPPGREVASIAAAADDPAAVVVIDTAGVNPFRAGEVAGLAGWLGAAGVEPVLVLPAGLDAHDAVEIVGAFVAIGVRRCVLTRLDAARRLGAVVAAGATGVALAEVSVSPLIGKPLLPLSAVGLARLLLRHGAGRGSA